MASAAQFDHLHIVLVGTRNPLNIGAAARAMSNFGFSCLRVVNPYEAAFREARSAVGASHLLAAAEAYKSVAEAVADCTLVVGTSALRHREMQHPVKRLEKGAPHIRRELASGRVALLFGSEKVGLSNDALSHCHWLMRIPTGEQHVSMNLGQAVAVCLYELVRQGQTAQSPGKVELATGEQLERFTATLLDALRLSGYLNPRSAAATQEKVRRLIRRLHLQTADAELWLGMLRQILWKLRSGERRARQE